MPSWARRCGGSRVMSWPSNTMRPPVGSSDPAMVLKIVVLPAPLGPMTARRWPRGMVMLTRSTARKASNATTTSESVRIGSSDTADTGKWDAEPAAPVVAGSGLLDALEAARIRRLLHVRLWIVAPELRNVRIAGDRHVSLLAIRPLRDFADVDVVDRVAVDVALDRLAQWRAGEFGLQHGVDQRVAVFDTAAELAQRLGHPHDSGIHREPVQRRDLAVFRFIFPGEFLRDR